MNAMQKALSIGGIGVLSAVVGFFGATTVAKLGSQTQHYAIKLVPQGGSGGELKADVKNQCNNNGHDGCLLFETKKVGQLKFYLKDSKFEMKKCEGTEKQAKNVITKIELTTKLADPTASKPNTERNVGDFLEDHASPTFTLDEWLKYDAFPAVNLSNGIVYEAPYDKAGTQVFLENRNSHDADEGIKSFWYRVTVTSCDPDKNTNVRYTWTTDPRGDNKGLK